MLKVLSDLFAGKELARERFAEEARITGMLAHPAIIRARDFLVEDDGRQALILDPAEGVTLDECLGAGRPAAFGVAELLAIARELSEALGVVHAAGFTHADISPRNVLIARGAGETRVVLIDFGLARAHSSEQPASEASGTPGYRAPEQRRGERVDARADIYGLGALLYALITGGPFDDPPLGREKLVARLHPYLAAAATPAEAGMALGLAVLVARCLEPNPSERPSAADELCACIEELTAAPADKSPGELARDPGADEKSEDDNPYAEYELIWPEGSAEGDAPSAESGGNRQAGSVSVALLVGLVGALSAAATLGQAWIFESLPF